MALIITAFFGLLYSPFLSGELKWGPHGRDVPTTPPDEASRIYHPLGFSIVAPPHWNAKVSPELRDILIRPTKATLSRSASLHLSLHGETRPSGDGTTLKTFQGLPAFLKIERREGTFDDPPWTFWAFLFNRHGKWFELTYGAPIDDESLPVIVQMYLETARFDAPVDEVK